MGSGFLSTGSTASEKIVILGTGPAGLTAAIYAARANLAPVCIEGNVPGGQLTITSEVENYPGFSSGVMGPELMDQFRKQAERFGTRFRTGEIVGTHLRERSLRISLSGGEELRAESLVIATGASANWMGLEAEKRLMGKGVSACATCDGFFFKNQDIVVVGGGDSAMEEATFLTRFARSVTVVHRRDHLKASKAMQEKAFKNQKIKFIWNSRVAQIFGSEAVEGVRLEDVNSGEAQDLAVTGVFVAIGHTPNTRIFRDQLKLDSAGYIVVRPGSTETSVPGVFAAGDVADKKYRQAITAAGTGCMAAIDAEKFLEQAHQEQKS